MDDVCWTARYLLKAGGRLILSSIQENAGLLQELLESSGF
jgi:hypothetical protein